MATTKKSTKAKTKTLSPKTRQSSAAQVKKPTTAAKSVKKTVSTKGVKLAPAKKSTVTTAKVKNQNSRLRQLYSLSAVITIGLAVVAGLLMNTRAYQLFIGLLTRDELASQTTTVFVPAIHSVYDLELRWVVVGIMALATVLPLVYLYLTRKRSSDEAGLDARLRFWRWLEIGIVTALIVETIALLSGVQDILMLKVIGGIIVISAVLRWLAEKQQAETPNMRRNTASILSIISCLLPGIIIGGYAIATVIYGMVRTPWYVYALYATLIVGFFGFVINWRASLKRWSQSNPVTQRNYVLVGLMVRIAFAAILIYGLHK